MPRNIIIRDVSKEDFDDIRTLIKHSNILHHQIDPEVYCQRQFGEKKDGYFTDLLANPQVFLKVAQLGNSVIGYIHGDARHRPTAFTLQHPKCLFVNEVVVDSQHKRLGVGTKLFEEATSWAIANKLDCIELDVAAKNVDAAAFYTQSGFRASKIRMFKLLDQS